MDETRNSGYRRKQDRFDPVMTAREFSLQHAPDPVEIIPAERPIIRNPVSDKPTYNAKDILTLGYQVTRQYGDKASEVFLHRKPVVPWMKWREIEIIKEILTRLHPAKCLEWGSGYSTAYFPHFIHGDSGWLSVEHDASWLNLVEGLNKKQNVTLRHVAPDNYPFHDLLGEGTRDDLRNYIEFPAREAPFDFVLIDGRARMECAAEAAKILDPQGVMVMHDVNREMYASMPSAFRHQVVYRDHRSDTGGLFVCSPGRSIDSILDIARHGRLWSLYSALGHTRAGRILRM